MLICMLLADLRMSPRFVGRGLKHMQICMLLTDLEVSPRFAGGGPGGGLNTCRFASYWQV